MPCTLDFQWVDDHRVKHWLPALPLPEGISLSDVDWKARAHDIASAKLGLIEIEKSLDDAIRKDIDSGAAQGMLAEQEDLASKAVLFADLSLEVKRRHQRDLGWAPADGSCFFHSLSEQVQEKVRVLRV